MKRLVTFVLSLIMLLALCSCATKEVLAPSLEPTEQIEDINTEALAILEDLKANHLADDEFINTILTQVPDAFMLTGFRAACWTYFLEMSDGIEYIVITDENGHITSIAFWHPEDNTHGVTIYTDDE